MLDEAIELMEKELNMYEILNENIADNTRTKALIRAKNGYAKRIKILKYILKILYKKSED